MVKVVIRFCVSRMKALCTLNSSSRNKTFVDGCPPLGPAIGAVSSSSRFLSSSIGAGRSGARRKRMTIRETQDTAPCTARSIHALEPHTPAGKARPRVTVRPPEKPPRACRAPRAGPPAPPEWPPRSTARPTADARRRCPSRRATAAARGAGSLPSSARG